MTKGLEVAGLRGARARAHYALGAPYSPPLGCSLLTTCTVNATCTTCAASSVSSPAEAVAGRLHYLGFDHKPEFELYVLAITHPCFCCFSEFLIYAD